jgi:2-oxoglutarate ferredoxin oxidoreductase subunit alpha
MRQELTSGGEAAPAEACASASYTTHLVSQHTVEIVLTGEGAEVRPDLRPGIGEDGNGVRRPTSSRRDPAPPRSAPAASGNRIRIGSQPVTNWGDASDLMIAFNEQVLLGRHEQGALAEHAIVLLDNQWKEHPDERIQAQWRAAMAELAQTGYRIIEVPLEAECLKVVDNARKGKNMFALGLLAWIYDRDLDRIREEIAWAFRKKSEEVYQNNVALLELGVAWAKANLDFLRCQRAEQ